MSACLLSSCAPPVVRHNEAGNERFEEGAYEGAIDEYRLAQVAEPDLAEPYYNAANAYNRKSQVDAALAQTQQALKTADPELAAQVWYNLGNAYFDAQQWPQAVEAYKEALRLQPDDLEAKHNLELALQKIQQQQQEQEQADQQNGQGDQQNQASEATPTPGGETASSGEQDSQNQATPQPSGAPQEAQGMTEEQAAQLLRALLGNSQTLRERLREIHQVPIPPPEQDW